MKKIYLVLILIIFYIIFFYNNGCENNRNAVKSLKIGILSFPNIFNPAYITDEVSTVFSNKVYDSLYYFDDEGKVSSKIIENEKLNHLKNGFGIRILLKKNIFFSNGNQLIFDDIVKTVDLLQNKNFGSPFLLYVSEIKGIRVKNKFEGEIIFKEYNANWKNYLSFKIFNSKEIKGISPKIFKRKMLSGSGPLKFKKINRPSEIILTINPYYIKSNKSRYSEIIYSVISYINNSPLKLVNNETDIVSLTYENVLTYRKNMIWQKNFKILKFRKFAYSYLAFNLQKKKLSLNIRKIFYAVLHNKGLIKKFLNGRGEEIKTPFLLLNEKVKETTYNIEKLKKKIEITVLSNIRNIEQRDFILFLSQEMIKYNIFLQPVFLENQLLIGRLKKGDFGIAIGGFILDIDYDMKDILYSDAYFNYTNYSNKNMDNLLLKGLKTVDNQKREKIYLNANKIWEKDLPFIPLYNLYFYKGVSNKIFIPKNTAKLIGSSGDFLQNIENWIFK